VQRAEIHAVQQVVLLLLLFVVLFAALARKLQTPYPIVLVVAGLLLSFVPGTPRVALHPALVFLLVLPPDFKVVGYIALTQLRPPVFA
jgi:CPA1 family monovalent cation:H+ antiporter